LATVSSDNYRIGCIAAEHLLERNFRSFGYYGMYDVWYSDERCRGFVETVERTGATCSKCLDTAQYDGLAKMGQLEHEELHNWIKTLDLPSGILAVQDYRARLVMEMCREIGLRIPEDIAVIGVNNDPTACLFASPELTSVAHDGVRVGMEAAALLDRLIAKPNSPRSVLQIPPLGVVARDSTDTVAVDDETLRRALELIKTSYVDDIGIEQIAAKMSVSRRWLEKLFRVHLKNTPHEYLSDIRVRAAKKLLVAKPPVKLNDVARKCGFYDVRRLNKVFAKVAGVSPKEFVKMQAERRN
jgi:LacI family transcriptional regulator